MLLVAIGAVLVGGSYGAVFLQSAKILPYSSFRWHVSGALLPSLRMRMLPSIDHLVDQKLINSIDTAEKYLGAPTSTYEFTASPDNVRRSVATFRIDRRRLLAFVFDDHGELVYHEVLDRMRDPSKRYFDLTMQRMP